MRKQKVKMAKKRFRIGEMARELQIKKFVIRFWEKEFGLDSDRSEGGQRFYTDKDLETFRTIKDLLYNQGYTIAGAKTQISSKIGGALRASEMENNQVPANIAQKLATIKEKLLVLQKLVNTL